MADRYRTPDGWTVEVVQLAAGDRLRIRHHGFIADALSVDDLARWIPAADRSHQVLILPDGIWVKGQICVLSHGVLFSPGVPDSLARALGGHRAGPPLM